MYDKRTVTSQQDAIAMGRGLDIQYNLRKQSDREVDGQHAHTFPLVINRQAERGEGFILGVFILQRVGPVSMACLHGFSIPHLLGIRLGAEGFRCNQLRILISHHAVSLTVHIGHKQLTVLIIIGLKDDGTPHDIRITLHKLSAVGVHPLWLIKMV